MPLGNYKRQLGNDEPLIISMNSLQNKTTTPAVNLNMPESTFGMIRQGTEKLRSFEVPFLPETSALRYLPGQLAAETERLIIPQSEVEGLMQIAPIGMVAKGIGKTPIGKKVAEIGAKEISKIAPSIVRGISKFTQKEISKELQPLAQEARKYKSAEEFVKAQTNVFHGTPEKGFKLEKGKPLFLTENFDEANTYAGYSYNTKPTGEVAEFYAKEGKTLDLNKTENVKKAFQDIKGSPELKKAYNSIPENYNYLDDYSGEVRTLNPKSSPSDFEDWMMMEYQSNPKIENGLKIRTGSYSFEKETQAIRKQLQEAFNTYGKPTRQSVYNSWDSLTKYAKDNGYDYIKHTTESPDASILFPEKIALNPEKSLLTKSQLTDIWNQANKAEQPLAQKRISFLKKNQ